MSSGVYRKFAWTGLVLAAILIVGAVGYWLIGGRQHSLLDVIYMTVITISTIGFAEIIDLSDNPAGRVFTIFIAVAGIGLMAYVVTNVTALIVEGELTESFRRMKMERMARNTKDHYIVCGMGAVGLHIVDELKATRRPYVIVEIDRDAIEKYQDAWRDGILVEGDATDNDTLLKAGVKKAKGVFAATGDDNQNLVISLTAKQLNPDVRMVTRSNDTKNDEKLQKSGADAVVSPGFIGGLRMASEMIRPAVVSFLDVMLRDKEKNLRIEEVPVPESFAARALSSLHLAQYPHLLLLAVKTKDGWIYHPPDTYTIGRGDILIFMATPEARDELERLIHVGR